jgi:cytochrome c peroxidase
MMNRPCPHHYAVALLASALVATSSPTAGEQESLPDVLRSVDPTGIAATVSTTGRIDLQGPFFQSLGTNGRACVTCHQPSAGWTITPENVRARFDATGGMDPIFRTNDGSNSPDAGVSTLAARRAAFSMLLDKGLIRVGIGIPEIREFELVAVDDPYGYASANELSLFRRPLPATNLKFLSTVMWDGRETFKDAASQNCILGTSNCFATIHFDLGDQANGATLGHAQGTQPLTPEERDAIVAFETGLFTAQVFDFAAGELTARKAGGGPTHLTRQDFYFGMNDVVSGDYRSGASFNPVVFNLFDSWDTLDREGVDEATSEARRSVARGQRLFNSNPIRITGVKGLNDDLGVPVFDGRCSTCHDTPAAGNHSTPAPLDIGLTDALRRTPDLPLYTLRHKAAPFEVVQTSDPGRALITGRWNDIGKFKGATLRALATRAPYFHNGSAANLREVVDFYDRRFGIGFTPQEKDDLVAFLSTL